MFTGSEALIVTVCLPTQYSAYILNVVSILCSTRHLWLHTCVAMLQEVSEALDQRSLHYVDTADQLMTLARNTLYNAR